MDRTAYKNRHIKEHYDRINFVIPKGEKDRIKKICSEIGASVNDGSMNTFICLCVMTLRMVQAEWQRKSRALMQNRNGCLKSGKYQENIMK